MKRLLNTAALITLGIQALGFCKKRTSSLLKEKAVVEKRIYDLVESSKDIIYYFEVSEFQFKYLSPSIDHFFGEGHLEDCMENPLMAFENLHPDDLSTVQNKLSGELDYTKPILQRWKDQEGNYLWFEEYATPIYQQGELVAVQGIIRNVDDKIKLQQSLKHQLYHDSLTGIHNRYFFDEKRKRLNEGDESTGIILCDLDNLKETNDRYGHKVGDMLIIETANLLQGILNDHIHVARIGGDEFVILLTNATYVDVQTTAEEIGEVVKGYNKEHRDNNIKLSLGYSFRGSSTGQMETLFHEADQMMYQDKNKKRDGTRGQEPRPIPQV